MPDADQGSLVTYEHCQQVSRQVLDSINEVKKEMERMNGNVEKVCGDVYGTVEHGQPKGGLVHIVESTSKNVASLIGKVDAIDRKMDKKTGLGTKERGIIVVALITGIFGLVIQLIKTFGGGG